MTERITTNKYGDQLFVLLDHNMTHAKHGRKLDDYKWKLGENPGIDHPWHEYWYRWQIKIGDLDFAVGQHPEKCYIRHNIHTFKLCWISVPRDRMDDRTSYCHSCYRAFVDRVMTVEELRKTGSPLYRRIITSLLYNQTHWEEPHNWSIINLATKLTEYEWMWYILSLTHSWQLEDVPEDYRKSVYICLVAQLQFPGNTCFAYPGIVVRQELVVAQLSCNFVRKFYRMAANGPEARDPRRPLAEWTVKCYNKLYNQQVEIPTPFQID